MMKDETRNIEYKLKKGKTTMKELKQGLIGQKNGMEFALNLLKMLVKSLENRIEFLDKEIEKIEE